MMNVTFKKRLTVLLCAVLIAAMALMLTGCTATAPENTPSLSASPVPDGASIGEGSAQFTLLIVDSEGSETHLTVHTDEKTVGAALLSLGVISGDQGQYGLYIKTVNGVTADYDKDGTYWAFMVGGQYASAGVDQTDIGPGESYELRVSR